MGLTMQERHAIVREVSSRFQRSRKKERSQILDSFVELTRYTRCYAAYVLRTCGRKQIRMVSGKRVVFVPAYARGPGAGRRRRGPYRSKAFVDALRQFWALSDGLCGKRLVVFIREIIPLLEQQGRLHIADQVIRQQLLSASAATMDRLLATTKRQSQLKGRSVTRPGTLLKYHIPVRTFADWSDVQPGFCEVDLVSHDGGSAFGEYFQTLTLTDVATGWTELEAAKNKARCNVFDALKAIHTRLPFALRGIDSDNGSEFINNHLIQFCSHQHITFTRSRPYRKNDNCYVEQKNYSVVRRAVAYYRYNTMPQLELLRALYRTLRLYTNYFQPVMKLTQKIRQGSKLTRRYDQPQTPYRRLLAHPGIPQEAKDVLTDQYNTLNVIALKRELNRLQHQLFRSAIKAGPPPAPPRFPFYPGPHHPWRSTSAKLQRALSAPPTTPENPLDFHKQNRHTPTN